MKLLTKAIEKKHRENKEKHMVMDKKTVVKLFNPSGAGPWWLWSMDDDDILFWVCEINCRELGYVALEEITSFKGRMGLPIERDMYYSSDKTFDEILNGE